ncbi:hypothetical protein FXN61_35335 [Lentzea sp. PSKA42]|uniref:Capsid maturation protease n=1 Tax=Lentzea indica TaxID=2604800 RepID=A0ABX1FSN8_9PSEU|nr:hypothetical protein [Lentzea indica]NKE61752.1 hypothetical protein [Lentzea indica]
MQPPAGASGLAFTTADADHYRAQQRIVRVAVDQAQAAWKLLNASDAFGSWTQLVRPRVVQDLEHAQESAAALAPLYIAATLATARAVSSPVAAVVAAAFAGFAANGLPLALLLDFAFRLYQKAVAAGMPPSEARAIGLARLLTYVSTETADAGRLAHAAAALAEPEIAGYERIIVLPACGRCILLAGRLYRYSTAFLRHPRCDCQMKPVTWEQWREDRPGNHPRALFEAMTPAQQNDAFGAGDADAIRAGADISRVVNARRRNAVYVAGGHEYTREATTVRGVGRQLGDLGKQPGRRYSSARTPRPTAAQLVNTARDRDELITQLRRFGYLR